jgi:hypothetical protein
MTFTWFSTDCIIPFPASQVLQSFPDEVRIELLAAGSTVVVVLGGLGHSLAPSGFPQRILRLVSQGKSRL